MKTFAQKRNTGLAQSAAVQQNVCVGGYFCAGPGRLLDYSHGRCGCCPERGFCIVSLTKYPYYSVRVGNREYISYFISSILLTDKVPVTVFETVT